MSTKPDYVCQVEYATFHGNSLPEALQKLVDYLEMNDGMMHEENTVIEVITPYCGGTDDLYRVSAMINAIHNTRSQS